MGYFSLPANSEKLLLELVQADNPVQMLGVRFKKATQREDDELRGILRELCERGFLNVQWAEGVPYHLELNNSARTYKEQLSKDDAKKEKSSKKKKESPIVFISHRSTDKVIADMLLDFFSGTGIPRETVFCSSLPGNDINEKISGEVMTALKNSVVNIAVLSRDYYQSAYCLNEAGIFWYNAKEDVRVPVIPIALPEINPSNMYGFLNSEYKLRKLNSDDDISYIYDIVSEAVSAPHTKVSIITHERQKLETRYADYLTKRDLYKLDQKPFVPISLSEITTDDERIVLYYVLKKNVRKVSKKVVLEWLHMNEIYDVDIDNAFDLLSSFGGGKVNNDTLEFTLEVFREFSSNSSLFLSELEESVNQHKKLAADTFNLLWETNTLDAVTKLFFSYIVDEKMCSFGDRWMAEAQMKSIKRWEDNNFLNSTLSQNYGRSLQFLIQNDLVFENDWTIDGHPCEYVLCASLQKRLFKCPDEIVQELQRTKNNYYAALPF